MVINFFRVVLRKNNGLLNFCNDYGVDYKVLKDKQSNEVLLIKDHSFEDVSDLDKSIILSIVNANNLIKINVTSSHIFVHSHTVSLIKNANIDEVDHWSLGKEFAWIKMVTNKTRRVQHSEPHPYIFSDSTLYTDEQDIYVISTLQNKGN